MEEKVPATKTVKLRNPDSILASTKYVCSIDWSTRKEMKWNCWGKKKKNQNKEKKGSKVRNSQFLLMWIWSQHEHEALHVVSNRLIVALIVYEKNERSLVICIRVNKKVHTLLPIF